MKAPDWQRRFAQRIVILCARFIDKRTVLPIRKVSLSHVRPMTDMHLIYFVLKEFVDFREVETLDQLALEIPEEERADVGKSLFFSSDLRVPDLAAEDVDEDELWVRYTQQIVDSNLPFPEASKLAVYPRARSSHGTVSRESQ